MSFIKKGRPFYSTKNLNKRRKKRPAWDDAMTDLSVYKSNPEELIYRKKIHQSKHLPSVRFQNEKKKNEKDEISLNLGKMNSRQLAIMKEVLYDQDQLKTVLEYSDRMMNKVADLYGDHPKRYQAFPSITAAPNAEASVINKVYLPKEVPEFHSRLDTLSSSLMDLSALNDDCHKQVCFKSELELSSASTESLPSVTYTSHNDMEQFRKLLETEEKNLLASQYPLPDQSPSQTAKILDQNPQDVPGAFTPNQNSRGLITAVNDTTKVNKVRRVFPEETSEEEPSSDRQFRLNGGISRSDSGFTLKDLKKVLEEMQREMIIYEENTGKVPAEKQQKETFSGYTMSLCQTVIKLCRYLRETDEKLQEQKKLCEEFTLETSQMKLLIDALTLNLIESQDKYNSLYADMKEYQRNTNEEIASLKKRVNLITNHGMNGTISPQIQRQRSSVEVEQQQQQQNYCLSSLLHQQLPSSQTHQQLPSQAHQQLPSQNPQQLPSQNPQQLPSQNPQQLPSQNPQQLPSQNPQQLPSQNPQQLLSQISQQLPSHTHQQLPSQTYQQLPTQTHQQLPSQTHQQLPSQTHQQLPSQTHQQLPSQTHQQLPSLTHQQLPSFIPQQLPTQYYAQLHTQIQQPQQQSSTQSHQQQKQTPVQVDLQQQQSATLTRQQQQQQPPVQLQQQQELAHLASNFHCLLDDTRKSLFGSMTEEVNINGWLDSSAAYEKRQGSTLSSNFIAAFQLSPPVQRTRVVSPNSKDPQEFLSDADLSTSKSILYSDHFPSLTQVSMLDTSAISNKPITETILPGQISEVYPIHNDTTATSFELPNLADVPVSQSVLPEILKDISARGNCLSPEIESKSFLASQIEELNKQHEEAERLLQKFLQSGKEQEEILKFGGEFERQSQTEFQSAQGTDAFSTLQSSNLISSGEFPQTLEQQRSNSPHMFNGVSPAISPINVEEDFDQAV